MTFEGYGDFALLPREIRDQIYEDLFNVTNVKDIAEYARCSKIMFSVYVSRSDTSILMASRALYREAHPIWKKYKARRLMRVKIDTGSKIIDTATSAYRPVTRPSINREGLRSDSWRYRRHCNCTKTNNSRRVFSIFFPDFASLNHCKNLTAFENLIHMETLLDMRHWRHCSSLNLIVVDPTWPLPLPGEDDFYERLHRGWTRRNVIKAREGHARTIARWFIILLSRWQYIFSEIAFTFGQARHKSGDGFDDAKDFSGLMSMIKKRVTSCKVHIR